MSDFKAFRIHDENRKIVTPIKLDRSLLQVGQTYVVSIATVAGRPGASRGNQRCSFATCSA